MRHHSLLKTFCLTLAAGLALAACDRREDVPPAAMNVPSDPAGTTGTAANDASGITPSPDTSVQQNPSAAGGITPPNDPGTSMPPNVTPIPSETPGGAGATTSPEQSTGNTGTSPGTTTPGTGSR